MKMLLLDVENREVKVVEANGLDDYYKFIGCRCIDIVRRWIGDVVVEIVIDDEGAIVDKPKKISETNPFIWKSNEYVYKIHTLTFDD